MADDKPRVMKVCWRVVCATCGAVLGEGPRVPARLGMSPPSIELPPFDFGPYRPAVDAHAQATGHKKANAETHYSVDPE